MKLPTTTIGDTDLEVSVIGFGGMHLSIDGRPPRDQALSVVHRALDSGITFIDTADSYCLDEPDKHHNERLIREALEAYEGDRSGVVVATKGGLMRHEGGWPRNGDPDHLRRTIRESVEALGGKPIQLWQHHAPDPDVSIEASLAPVREAVDEGLIRHVGVSNYSVEEIERARNVIRVVSVQNQFSLWHRKPLEDGTLEYCDREGLTFLPWGPVGGRRRAKRVGEHDVLVEMAQARERSPHCIALAWLRAKSPVVLPIPGASRPESIADSAKAADVTLSQDEVKRLEHFIDA
ncbi:MAG: aldo/keto reductase [Rhodothermales bacterium]